jgi:Ca2+-binding EF-hand superfamily protein
MELEVDTVLVLKKRMKFRLTNGELTSGELRVYECEEPYVLVFIINLETNEEVRADVFKDELAKELRAWLEGKYIRHPAILVPSRIDDTITRFVKFAKTPKQEDLLMWMLSRSELYPKSSQENELELVFGGKTLEESDERLLDWKRHSVDNPYAKTATIAAAYSTRDEDPYRSQGGDSILTTSLHRKKDGGTTAEPEDARHTLTHSNVNNPNPNETFTKSIHFKHGDDLGMFSLTKQLLGKSRTLESLRNSRVQGRDGARQVMKTHTWTSDHWRLCSEIERARKDIEKKMDERRRIMEIAKTRQEQAAAKHKKIKETIYESQGGNRFLTEANQELLTLKKIEDDIEDDIRRQKNRVMRGQQLIQWTLAPAGFANRRGKSVKGPKIGPGPLPPKATGTLKNPAVEMTMRKYYWDSCGRRHVLDLNEEAQRRMEEESLVSQAMEAIRRAAANISSFKLNLKQVFEEFDTSGDGFLSPMEMAQAFLRMGVQLDIPTMNSIFQHFDPDGSGSVHYGEFVWAFFNRRGLVRQWQRKTKNLTFAQIKERFHRSDINGDGNLDAKEFQRVLKAFGMSLPKEQLEILIDRFDLDGDGEINMQEFLAFIESEQKNFGESPVIGTAGAAVAASALLPATRRTDSPNARNHPPPPNSSSSSSRGPSPVLSRDRNAPSRSQTPLSQTARPSSAPPRPPAPSRSLHATAPSHLQRQHVNYREDALDDDDRAHQRRGRPSSAAPAAQSRSVDHSRPEGTVPSPSQVEGKAAATARRGDVEEKSAATTTTGPMKDEVDVMWMARMLQTQAEIESRLGNRYFRNA